MLFLTVAIALSSSAHSHHYDEDGNNYNGHDDANDYDKQARPQLPRSPETHSQSTTQQRYTSTLLYTT